jgi:hypothetical protein
MKDRFVILGLQKESVYKLGEIVDKFWVYYFKPEHSNSRLFKGYVLTRSDCQGILDFSEFEDLPGIYNCEYSIAKSEPVFKSVSLVEPFSIPEVEDTLLIFSARPAEFQTEDKQLKKGINCNYIDSSGFMETSNMLGYIPSKAWCDKLNFNIFPQVPAYYSVSLSHVNNRKGEAIVKISEPKMVRPFQPTKDTNQAA